MSMGLLQRWLRGGLLVSWYSIVKVVMCRKALSRAAIPSTPHSCGAPGRWLGSREVCRPVASDCRTCPAGQTWQGFSIVTPEQGQRGLLCARGMLRCVRLATLVGSKNHTA